MSKRNKGEARKNTGAKIAYRPIGLISGLVAGSLSGIVSMPPCSSSWCTSPEPGATSALLKT